MGYAAVEHVRHAIESLLARVRSGEAAATAALVEALLDGADALDAAVEAAVQGTVAPDVTRVVAVLEAAAEVSALPPDDGGVEVAHDGLHVAPDPRDGPATGLRVTVRIAPGAPLPGVRAFLALRQAEALAAVSHVAPSRDALGTDAFDGTVRFTVPADVDAAALAAALRSVGDVADVQVRAAGDAPAPATARAGPRRDRLPPPRRRSARRCAWPVPTLDHLLDSVGELAHARAA
jgi:hypothetical protein